MRNSIKPGKSRALPWWKTITGITASTVKAAYRATNVVSYTRSLVNLANPGTLNLTTSSAPSWDAGNGWLFDGSSNFLDSGYTTISTSVLFVRFVNTLDATAVAAAVAGATDSTGSNGVVLFPRRSTGSAHAYVLGAASPGGGSRVPSDTMGLSTNGAAANSWLNGVDDLVTTKNWVSGPGVTLYLGGQNKAATGLTAKYAGYIQAAIIIEATDIDATKAAAIHAKLMSL